MSVYFNELTIDEIPQQTYQLLKDFRSVWSKFVSATDKKIKDIVLPHSEWEKLWIAVSSNADPAMMEFMRFFRPKFIEAPEDSFSPQVNDRFDGLEYRIKLENGAKVECRSLGWASLNRSVTLGLQSSEFWGRLCYNIECYEGESLDYPTSEVTVLCITKPSHIDDAKVKAWITANQEFADVSAPVPTSLSFGAKKQPSFKVPHHENEKLKDFCNKLVRYPYVVGVVDTLRFDSTTSRFILRCYEDGTIDIRLHWTETGCGLKVQTTGQGKRQTELIGKWLQEEFDRRS